MAKRDGDDVPDDSVEAEEGEHETYDQRLARKRYRAGTRGLNQQPHPHRRARADPPDQVLCGEAPDDTSDSDRSHQHTVTDRAEAKKLLCKENEDRDRGGHRQIHDPKRYSKGAQQPVAPEPPEPLGDLGPDRRRRRSFLTLDPELTPDQQHKSRRDGERNGIQEEWDGGGYGE